MRITISKGGHNHLNYLPNSFQNQSIQSNSHHPERKMPQKQTNTHKQKLKGQKIQNDFCCERWLSSSCLEKDKGHKSEYENEVQIIKPQLRAKYNQQRLSQSQQKLIVVSNGSQQKLQLNFPRPLQCLRDFGKRQIKILNLQMPNKVKENEQTKKNTEFPITRQISILSSISKQEVRTRQLSMIQSCKNDKNGESNKKLNLTVSRRSKLYANSNGQISEKNDKELLSTQKKQTQSIIYDKKQTTIQQSSQFLADKSCASQSEFKIEDPFDQFKSLSTEYLKQKIAFSSVESEKDQIHHQILEPIFVKKNIVMNPFLKKQTKISERFCKQIKVENKDSLSSEFNSQESVVKEKNFQKMFQFSLPSFSKMTTSEQTPAIYNSVILSSLENEKSLQ